LDTVKDRVDCASWTSDLELFHLFWVVPYFRVGFAQISSFGCFCDGWSNQLKIPLSSLRKQKVNPHWRLWNKYLFLSFFLVVSLSFKLWALF